MADTNYYIPNTTKMRSRDRIFKLGIIDNKLPKNSTGMVDTRLFSGENNLHAKMDPETCFWSLQYGNGGVLPQPLKVNFTSFPALKRHVEDYFRTRNIEIKEIQD